MRILVRVDASPRIGIGHVRRCLTLARALSKYGAEVRFAMHDWSGGHLFTLIKEYCATAFSLSADCPVQSIDPQTWLPYDQKYDFDAVRGAAREFSPNWVIVDHYALDAEWHEMARRSWNCRLLAIDDLADRRISAELLLDQNWDANHHRKYRHSMATIGEVLGGPRYALIDPRYGSCDGATGKDDVRSIGVFMGGTDPGVATIPVLQAIRAAKFTGAIGVVTSSLNPNCASVEEFAQRDGQISLDVDLPDLVDFFTRHDLYIVAAGGATWERMASGVPAIAIVTAENQRNIASQLAHESLQWTVEAGKWPELIDLLPVILADSAGRNLQARRGQDIVDAKGAARVAAAIISSESTPVYIRLATKMDAQMVHSWRNDPSIRAVSRNKNAITLDTHIDWFEKMCASPDHHMFIAEISGVPVGIVRFDRLGTAEFEISLFLDPVFAGRGIGLPMIQAAQEKLSALMGSDIVVLAETLPDNVASQRLFQKAGYDQAGLHFTLELIHHRNLLLPDNAATDVIK